MSYFISFFENKILPQTGCRDIEMGKINLDDTERVKDVFDALEPETSIQYEILICSLETNSLLREVDTYYHLTDIDF